MIVLQSLGTTKSLFSRHKVKGSQFTIGIKLQLYTIIQTYGMLAEKETI